MKYKITYYNKATGHRKAFRNSDNKIIYYNTREGAEQGKLEAKLLKEAVLFVIIKIT